MNTYYSKYSDLNSFWMGLFLGIGLPFILFLIYFLFRFGDHSFVKYLQILFQTGKIVNVISFAAMPNLIPFMFFVKRNYFKTGRGVIAATILYALLGMILKFYL